MRLCDVTPLSYLPHGRRQTFTYRVPSTLRRLPRGSLVLVPFRQRRTRGLVVRAYRGEPPRDVTLQTVLAALPYVPLTTGQQRLLDYLVRYDDATATLAAKTAIPALVLRPPRDEQPATALPPATLTPREEGSLRALVRERNAAVLTGRLWDPRRPFFVEYLRRRTGRTGQALCLFPDRESLAATTAAYGANGVAATPWHAALSGQERSRTWRRVAAGASRLVLGTRSAIFLPFRRLAAIVVFGAEDEGHRSWDQQPHYDVRLLARTRAEAEGSTLLFAQLLEPLQPRGRIFRQPLRLAPFSLIDRRSLSTEERRAPLPSAAAAALGAPRRALVFLNRRGPGVIACRACGDVVRCERCLLAFAYPTPGHALTCDRCGNQTPAPTTCPRCGAPTLGPIGLGVEQVASWLTETFPSRPVTLLAARVGRGDGEGALAPRLNRITRSETALVVATAAILPRLWLLPRFDVTVVLRAEQLFAANDWRASERALTALATLGAASAHVVVDTALPTHPTLTALRRGEVRQALEREASERRRFGYPPATRLIKLTPPPSVEPNALRAVAAALAGRPGTNVSVSRTAIVVKLDPTLPVSTLRAGLPVGWRLDVDPDNLTSST